MSRVVLSFTQKEALAQWLRENYEQRGLTDPQALEEASQALAIAGLTQMHVSYMREHLGIAKNYARKPRATVEGRDYVVDAEIDIPHLYRRLAELEKRVHEAEKRLYEMEVA